ncbi:MAG: hypothetical protein RBQ97_12020 [Acholeplasma sp.]|nr:hypothetical protein [Acholeplasma sp.]
MKRIALIIPNTDITLETDLQINLPPDYILHTDRMYLKDVTSESEKKMVDEELPKSIKSLKNITDFDLAIFGCTSASAIYGLEGLNNIRNLMQDELNCKATSAFEAVLNYIKEKEYKRIALITPYNDEVNAAMIKSLAEFNINVTYSKGLGLIEDIEISKVKPDEILKFVEENKNEITINSDICFISCTNFRAMEIREKIMELLDIEVITSNYCIFKFLVDAID